MPERPPSIVCDATMVLNLGHRGGLAKLAWRLQEERGLIVTPEVVREVTKSDPDFYLPFLADHFITVEKMENPPPDEAKLDDGLLGDARLFGALQQLEVQERNALIGDLKLNVPLADFEQVA